MKKVHDKLFRLEHGIVVLGEHCLLSGYFSFLSRFIDMSNVLMEY